MELNNMFPKPSKKIKGKTSIKKASKRALPIAKAKAWKQFSIYRRRKEADKLGLVRCFTCGTVKLWKEMDAGHFYHGTLDFNEYNVNPQCVRCNKWLHGNGIEYCLAMIRMYGQEVVDQLTSIRHVVDKLTVSDYQTLEEKYKKLNENYENN